VAERDDGVAVGDVLLGHDREVVADLAEAHEDALEHGLEAEILDINTLARNRSLQIALLVPVIAGLLGLANALRMMRRPDLKPSAPLEGMEFG
jgi:hypothetical protein